MKKKPVKIGNTLFVKLSVSEQLRQKKAELWLIFSRYIRYRDKLKCYTCGKQHYKLSECHAGHYRPQGGSSILAVFNPKNVHCQCISCNKWKSGNLGIYAEYLERDYGFGILQEISLQSKQLFKPTLQWYEDHIRYYSMKLTELEGLWDASQETA